MGNLVFLMDDRSISNDKFAVENNIEKIKSYTYNLSDTSAYSTKTSMDYSSFESNSVMHQVIL